MNQKDENYFSAHMHKMADMFNSMAKAVEKYADNSAALEADSILQMQRINYHSFIKRLSKEFEEAGYTADDWNDLMRRSGAGKKMGMGA
jgi:hypothetical protein